MSGSEFGCYGKLPIHADYIRHNFDPSRFSSLLRWLEEGVATAKRRRGSEWGGGLAAGRATQFLWGDVAAGLTVCGAMVAGRDRAGRRWPFFVVSPMTELGPEECAASPVVRRGFLSKAVEVVQDRGGGIADLDALRGLLDGLESPGLVDPEGGLGALTVGDVIGAQADGVVCDAWCLSLANLEAAFAGRGAPRYVLRAACFGGNSGVAFLLEAARRLQGDIYPSLVCWDSVVPGGVCRILYDRLDARYYAPMFWESEASDLAFDISSDGLQDESRMQQARNRFGPLFADSSAPAARILDVLG